MRHFAILFLLWLAVCAAADPAGRFTGDWKSSGGGNSGTFRMNLDRAGGAWKLEVTFTLAGEQEVKTTMREVKIDGDKLEAAYDFDLAGNMLRSRITGQLSGDKFEGKYRTTTVDGSTPVDEGTWNAARAK